MSVFRKKILLIIFISFVFMSVFGIILGTNMKNGKISSCPFSALQKTMCQMGLSYHISSWQKLFLSARKNPFFIFIVLLFIVFFALFTKHFPKLAWFVKIKTYYHNRAFKIFNHLILAFSDGIIHPNIYNLLFFFSKTQIYYQLH